MAGRPTSRCCWPPLEQCKSQPNAVLPVWPVLTQQCTSFGAGAKPTCHFRRGVWQRERRLACHRGCMSLPPACCLSVSRQRHTARHPRTPPIQGADAHCLSNCPFLTCRAWPLPPAHACGCNPTTHDSRAASGAPRAVRQRVCAAHQCHEVPAQPLCQGAAHQDVLPLPGKCAAGAGACACKRTLGGIGRGGGGVAVARGACVLPLH